MSNGSIDYAMPDFQDPFKGFREELGNIETKRKQSQEKAFEMAEMIEAADSATMFGNDYSIATKWAQNLTDNLSAMSSSTDGMIQFAQQANMLKSFIDGSEAYRTENIGSVKDGPQAGHWQGAVQRSISGVNPYGDQRDGKSMSDHEAQYKDLNESLEVAFDESGSPIIRKGGREMSLSQYQRPENPFMPSLVDDFFSESGFNWYDGRQEALKHAHTSADAAKEMALNSLDERMIRGIVNTHLKGLKDSEMSFEEAIKNEDVRKKAINNWLGGVANAWEGKNVVDAVDAEDMIFSGGLTSPEGFKTEVPGSGLIKEGDYIANSQGTSDLLNNLGSAIESPLETVGFNSLRMLNEPVNHDFTAELGEEQQIVAVNVDRNGNIHATLQTLTDDPNGELGFEGNKIKTNSVVVYEVDSPLHGTLKNKLTPEVYKNMLAKSESVSSNQRRLRIKRAFDNAIPYEGVTYGAPGSESAGSPTEATPTPTETASVSAPEGERSRIPFELGRNEAVSEQELNDELGKLKNPLINARTGEMSMPSNFVSDLFSDALAAGYAPDLIRSVFESPDFTLRTGGGDESQLLSYSQHTFGQAQRLRSKAQKAQGLAGTLLRGVFPGMTPAFEHSSNYQKEREKAFDKFEELARATSPSPPIEAFAGQESTSGIEGVGRPTDLGSPAPVVEPDAVVNPAAEPIQTEAPEAAAVIQNSNVEATNPNTGSPVTVDASAPEKQESAITAFGGIIPLNVQEADIQEYIQELFTNVVPSDSTWLWDNAQEQYKTGNNSDPVPAWCAVWVADMLMKADPDFDFSAVESEKYGQEGSLNRVRARQYETIGEAVSKTGDRYDAQVGDIVIKKSGESGYHIGFFAGYDGDGNVLILGGNQEDSLNVTPYPSSSIQTVRRVDVAAIKKEDVEKISATIGSSGKTS